VARLREHGATVEVDDETGLLLVNGEILVAVVLSRCRKTAAGRRQWRIPLEHAHRPDLTIAVRMDEANEGIHDYYLLPSVDLTMERLRLAEENGAYLDAYRYGDLSLFWALAARTRIAAAA